MLKCHFDEWFLRGEICLGQGDDFGDDYIATLFEMTYLAAIIRGKYL